MDVGRLLYAARFALSQIKSADLVAHINALAQGVTRLAASPTSSDLVNGLKDEMEGTYKALEGITLDSSPLPVRRVLIHIQAGTLFASAVRSRVESLLGTPGVFITTVSESMKAYEKELKATIESLELIETGLARAGIEPLGPPADACEVAVLLPEQLHGGQVSELQQHLKQWKILLESVAELKGGTATPLVLRSLSRGSIEFTFAITVDGAHAMLLVLGVVSGALIGVRKWQQFQRQLEEGGAPSESIAPLKAEERKEIETAGEKAVDALIENGRGRGEGRMAELKNGIAVAVAYLVKVISAGAQVDVVPPELPNDGGRATLPPGAVEAIRRERSAVHEKFRQLAQGPPPELPVREGATDAAPPE